MVIGTFAKAVFFVGARPIVYACSRIVVIDTNTTGCQQTWHSSTRIALAWTLCFLSSQCRCPQPPNADLITVDINRAGDEEVKNNKTRRSKNGASRSNSIRLSRRLGDNGRKDSWRNLSICRLCRVERLSVLLKPADRESGSGQNTMFGSSSFDRIFFLIHT